MKKLFVLTLFISITSLLSAQRNFWAETKGIFFYNNDFDYETTELLKEKDFIKENQISEREKIHYHNGNTRQYLQYFDQEGRIVKSTFKSEKGGYETTYEYNNTGNLTKKVSTNYKGQKAVEEQVYNDQNQLVKKEKVGYKGKYSGIEQEFNKEGKIVSKKIFDKKDAEPTNELLYTYYEDGSKQSETYKKNGKIKYVWNYDCKSDGELIDVKNKDNSTICIKEETDESGNRTVWKRDFDENGELVKTMSVFTKDSVFIEMKSFTADDRLLKYVVHKKEGGIRSIVYDKKGDEEKVLNQYNEKRSR